MSRKQVSIYTKGTAAAPDKPGCGGYAALLCHNDIQKQLSGGFRLTTGKRMNIMAAVAGLEALKTSCTVQLYTNCEHLVEAMTNGWPQDWKANKWCYGNVADGTNKSRVENVDLWDKLSKLCNQHNVEFNWIANPAVNEWYQKCDEIAREAVTANSPSHDDGYLHEILVRLDHLAVLRVLLPELDSQILLDYAEKARASGRNERAQELESRGKRRAAEERRANEKQTLLEKLRWHFKNDFLSAGNFYQDQCSTHISLNEYEDEKIGYISILGEGEEPKTDPRQGTSGSDWHSRR